MPISWDALMSRLNSRDLGQETSGHALCTGTGPAGLRPHPPGQVQGRGDQAVRVLGWGDLRPRGWPGRPQAALSAQALGRGT